MAEQDYNTNRPGENFQLQNSVDVQRSSMEGSMPRRHSSDANSTEHNYDRWTALVSKLGVFERILPEAISERLGAIAWNERPSQRESRPWMPTIIRFGPLSGICSMFIAFASIMASLGVLIGSNGASVLDWTAPPSTYLAMFTALANLAVRYACIQGVVIAWWCKALRGSSFKQLHYDYRAGTTLGGAITSGRYTGLLGIACIASTLVVIDGPLLQRASTVVPTPFERPIPLNMTMAAQVPNTYTGAWLNVAAIGNGYNYSLAFNGTMPAAVGRVPNNIYVSAWSDKETKLTRQWFFKKAPLEGVFDGCPGKCRAKLVAPALAVTACSSHQIPIDRRHQKLSEASVWTTVPSINQDSFIIGFELVVDDEQEKINLVTAYTTLEDCVGVLNLTACTLKSAVGEYTVSIDNNIATVDLDSAVSPRILELSNNAAVNHTNDPAAPGYHPSTLAGIVGLLWTKWDGYSSQYKQNGVLTQFVVDPGATYSYEKAGDINTCHSFSDPTDNMFAEMNMLMVYTGMMAAEESRQFLDTSLDPKWADRVRTTITGQQVGHESVFHTNFHYFIAAAVVELVCIALIAPTYIGFWKLGRHMSFSPLEIAKAFRSPLLAGSNSNATGREIANSLGESPVQYGTARELEGEKTTLSFADTEFVESPRKGERFDA